MTSAFANYDESFSLTREIDKSPDGALMRLVPTLQQEVEPIEGLELVEWAQLNATNDPLTDFRSNINKAKNGAIGKQGVLQAMTEIVEP
jgi:hypothetical protein